MIDKMIKEIKETITNSWNKCELNMGSEYVNEIIDEIAEKYKSQEQRWISVEERLPEDDTNVLAIIECRMVGGTCNGELNTMCDVTWYCKCSNKWFLTGLKDARVIAWMPLPEYHFANADKKIGDGE